MWSAATMWSGWLNIIRDPGKGGPLTWSWSTSSPASRTPRPSASGHSGRSSRWWSGSSGWLARQAPTAWWTYGLRCISWTRASAWGRRWGPIGKSISGREPGTVTSFTSGSPTGTHRKRSRPRSATSASAWARRTIWNCRSGSTTSSRCSSPLPRCRPTKRWSPSSSSRSRTRTSRPWTRRRSWPSSSR